MTAASPLILPTHTGPIVQVKGSWMPDEIRQALKEFNPSTRIGKLLKTKAFRFLPASVIGEILDELFGIVVVESQLAVKVIRGAFTEHGVPFSVEDYGVVSRRLVTDVGVAFIVDAFQNSTELENFKYHGLGTATTAENANQTGLTTELTTQYNPNSTRATGTTTESAANAYLTVATNTLDASATIEEHGVFSAASAGTLLDRSLTGTQTLSSGDGLQSSYTLTFTSGG